MYTYNYNPAKAAHDCKIFIKVMLLKFSKTISRITFHCYYSQVHPDPEWLYLLGSHLWLK